jgi:hypothetical protein
MAQRTISHGDFLKLVGLFGLAEKHRQELDAAKLSAGQIVGDQRAVSYAIDRRISASSLLVELGIGVEPMKEGE